MITETLVQGNTAELQESQLCLESRISTYQQEEGMNHLQPTIIPGQSHSDKGCNVGASKKPEFSFVAM